jgi:SAM-dependent methyltransferase
MNAKDLTPEKIVDRIRARLEGRQQKVVPQGERPTALAMSSQGTTHLADDIAADLELIDRKKFPGYIPRGSRFALLKKLMRRLMLVYTREQMEYNDGVSKVLLSLATSMQHLQSATRTIEADLKSLDSTVSELHSFFGRIDEIIAKVKSISEKVREIESSSQSHESQINSLAEDIIHLKSPCTIARLAAQAHYPGDEFYFQFEEAFRASEELNWQRWEQYAALVADHFAAHSTDLSNAYHVDVGCGRGEFLEHLKSRGVQAKGVDSNDVMVTHCRELDLEVTKADALAYLAELQESSLLSISAFQLIEHLFLKDLCDFFTLSYRALRPGGLLILETVNPESLYALRWFFIDFTHTLPLFADMIRFMLTKTGFRDIEVRPTSPVESWKQLGAIGHQKADENFHKLNHIVFGYQDYAVLARK